MGKKSWMAGKGYDGMDEEVADSTPSFRPRRFYIPFKDASGNHVTKRVIFVDDEPQRFYEHNVCIKGSWRNWATCPDPHGETGECDLCNAGDKPYLAAAWTVIDRSEWTDKKGKLHKDEPRLFIAKAKIMTKLSRLSQRYRDKGANGLVGICFEVSRSDAKASNVGDEFEPVSKAGKVLTELDAKPFDYDEALEPDFRQIAKYARMLGGAPRRDASAGDEGDDVPW